MHCFRTYAVKMELPKNPIFRTFLTQLPNSYYVINWRSLNGIMPSGNPFFGVFSVAYELPSPGDGVVPEG